MDDEAPPTSQTTLGFMQKSELTKLLPKNGKDVEGARAILALGFPTIEPVLPSLFQWLETSGSDVELLIRPFFNGKRARSK